ncbi:MAG: hypothetical protein H0U54_17870 [Acidobacteria bacterium]|nr:hypothetical protein [Acidobacteriota bacterium]
MHDCRTLEERLVDLVFDELDTDEKLHLLAEVETCAGCLREYRSMTSSLLVFDEAVEASAPDESYWPVHQAMLRRRLEEVTPHATAQSRESFWKRIFTTKLPVPVPVAAALVLALLVSSVLALRPSTKEAATTTQLPTVVKASPEIIEVPVYREKVVTRTVYVEKKMPEKNATRPRTPVSKPEETTLTARHAEKASGQGGFFTQANLTDFQPADEMRIRVIKRSNSDEN